MFLALLAPPDAAGDAVTTPPLAIGLPALDIEVGRAEVLRLARPPGTVVVGDERIVALNMISDRIMVLSGLQAGETNVIVLGEQGEAMTRFLLRVVRSGRVLTVRRGTAAEVYRCETSCRPVTAARIAPVPGAGAADPASLDTRFPDPAPADPGPADPVVKEPAETSAVPLVTIPAPAPGLGAAEEPGRAPPTGQDGGAALVRAAGIEF